MHRQNLNFVQILSTGENLCGGRHIFAFPGTNVPEMGIVPISPPLFVFPRLHHEAFPNTHYRLRSRFEGFLLQNTRACCRAAYKCLKLYSALDAFSLCPDSLHGVEWRIFPRFWPVKSGIQFFTLQKQPSTNSAHPSFPSVYKEVIQTF